MPRRRIANDKKRTKRYKEIKKMVESTKVYTLEEAVALAIATSKVKFDASVEFHTKLGIDPKKGDQQIRSTVSLPNGTGKKLRIAAIVPDNMVKEVTAAGAALVGGTELIEKIASTGKTDFDIVITTPDMMKDMAKVAKVLGPKGLMPNPKTETVVANPVKAIGELSKGKINFKNDDQANIHVSLGKVSFGAQKITENLKTFLDVLKKLKPSSSKGVFIRSAYLTTTMGPAIKFQS